MRRMSELRRARITGIGRTRTGCLKPSKCSSRGRQHTNSTTANRAPPSVEPKE